MKYCRYLSVCLCFYLFTWLNPFCFGTTFNIPGETGPTMNATGSGDNYYSFNYSDSSSYGDNYINPTHLNFTQAIQDILDNGSPSIIAFGENHSNGESLIKFTDEILPTLVENGYTELVMEYLLSSTTTEEFDYYYLTGELDQENTPNLLKSVTLAQAGKYLLEKVRDLKNQGYEINLHGCYSDSALADGISSLEAMELIQETSLEIINNLASDNKKIISYNGMVHTKITPPGIDYKTDGTTYHMIQKISYGDELNSQWGSNYLSIDLVLPQDIAYSSLAIDQTYSEYIPDSGCCLLKHTEYNQFAIIFSSQSREAEPLTEEPLPINAINYVDSTQAIKDILGQNSPQIIHFGEAHYRQENKDSVPSTLSRFNSEILSVLVDDGYADFINEYYFIDTPQEEFDYFFEHGEIDIDKTPFLFAAIEIGSKDPDGALNFLDQVKTLKEQGHDIRVYGGTMLSAEKKETLGNLVSVSLPAESKDIFDLVAELSSQDRKIVLYNGCNHNNLQPPVSYQDNYGLYQALDESSYGKTFKAQYGQDYLTIDLFVPELFENSPYGLYTENFAYVPDEGVTVINKDYVDFGLVFARSKGTDTNPGIQSSPTGGTSYSYVTLPSHSQGSTLLYLRSQEETSSTSYTIINSTAEANPIPVDLQETITLLRIDNPRTADVLSQIVNVPGANLRIYQPDEERESWNIHLIESEQYDSSETDAQITQILETTDLSWTKVVRPSPLSCTYKIYPGETQETPDMASSSQDKNLPEDDSLSEGTATSTIEISGMELEQLDRVAPNSQYLTETQLSGFVKDNGPLYTNPVDFITDRFEDNQVVTLGECHTYGAEQQFVANLIPSLYDAGVRYLILEIRSSDQEVIDNYLSSGEETPELKRAIAGFREEYINILNAAREFSDLKVVAIDPRPKSSESSNSKSSDEFPHNGNIEITRRIKDDILASEPDAKIFVYYGEGHLEKNDPFSIPTQLKESVEGIYTITGLVSAEVMGDTAGLGGSNTYSSARETFSEYKIDKTNFINVIKEGSNIYSAIFSSQKEFLGSKIWLGELYDAVLYLGAKNPD